MHEVTARFIKLFNIDQDYYECHEIFEDAWKESLDRNDKMFYKALVQVATAQFKLQKGLLNGVRKLYKYAQPSLEKLPPTHQEIDILKLRTDFAYQVSQLPDMDVIDEHTYSNYGIELLQIEISKA